MLIFEIIISEVGCTDKTIKMVRVEEIIVVSRENVSNQPLQIKIEVSIVP
jgi:hypothetical protein